MTKYHRLILRLLAVALLGLAATTLRAHDEKKKTAGPNGGRLITAVKPHAEFLVRPDRKVQITFVDNAGKPIAPVGQVVTVTAGERMSPKTLTFSTSENVLISNAALPAGDKVPAVVQIKATPDATTVYEKFNVDLSICGECEKAEYACICAH